MEFKFDGLDTPIVLPDDVFTFAQYGKLQRFLLNHGDPLAKGDLDLLRAMLGELTNNPEFVSQTDNLPMNIHNRSEWEGISTHLERLATGSTHVGDSVVNEVESVPLERKPRGRPKKLPEHQSQR